MGDPRHIDRLRQGARAWNAWRRQEPSVLPDLSTEVLRRADLAGFDLRGADLRNADLRAADLRRARLQGALLYNVDGERARFDGARLDGANLSRALFPRANLREARLDGARLEQTQLDRADLTDASFRGAWLIGTTANAATTLRTRFTDASLDSAELCQCDLSSCDFRGSFMGNARFVGSRLRGVNLADVVIAGSVFWKADLRGADLRCVDAQLTDFAEARLRDADLRGAGLLTSELREADLRGARLDGADLTNASLVRAKVEGASFQDCTVYGLSAWDLSGTPARQHNLSITPAGQAAITVDSLEAAQVLYLMYGNQRIRTFIDECTRRNVLILGRFTPPDRKAVLDGLRERLRQMDLVPIVFDFERPRDRNFTETVQSLASLSHFVIVDLTLPKSTPLELEATVKHFQIPYAPIIDASADPWPFTMFSDLANSFHWVLKPVQYRGRDQLLQNLDRFVVQPAKRKQEELRRMKANSTITMVSIDEVLAAEAAAARRRR